MRRELADSMADLREQIPRLVSVEFLEAGGESVLVTEPERLEEALAGRAGTWILR